MKKYQPYPDFKTGLISKSNKALSSASTLGKVIRSSLSPLLYGIRDSTAHGRLLKILLGIVRESRDKVIGINSAGLSRLKGFQFNAGASLNSIFSATNSVEIDREGGRAVIHIPSFNPSMQLRVPAFVTHYQFVTACVEMDFELQRFQVSTVKSGECINYSRPTDALTLLLSITPGSTLPVFIAFTIKLYQEHSGILYPLANCAINGVQLLEVDSIKRV